jgi:hypothetical protein
LLAEGIIEKAWSQAEHAFERILLQTARLVAAPGKWVRNAKSGYVLASATSTKP